MSNDRFWAVLLVFGMIATAFAVAVGGVSADQGTRDSYGYRWTDSNSPSPSVPFNWVEINSTGTNSGVTGDDNYGGPFNIGFSFNFYGNTYTQFYISTNGFISFGGGSSSLSNYNIPNSGSPNNIIAAYWDDDAVYSPAVVHYQTMGTSPDQQLVVEYTNFTRWAGSNHMTLEVILNETGDVWIQYLQLNGETGSSATVGIENSAGTVGTQYSYNTNSLSNNLAIRFSVGPLMVSPFNQAQSVMPGTDATFSLTIQNRQTFADSFKIGATSAHGWALGLYDGSMNPLTDSDGDGYPDTGSLASFASFTVMITVSVPASPSVNQDITTVNVSSHSGPSLWEHNTLTTNVQPAWFNPPHASSAVDTDGDGSYNVLIVSASVYVFTAGWFTVQGFLYTASDFYISGSFVSNYTYLAAGSQTVQMLVHGWYISNYGVDGPYHMDLSLYSGGTLLDTGVQTTSAYAASSFMLQPGTLVTPFTGGGVDSDGNGLFDYLEVNVTLDVNYAGRFVVTGTLYDHDYTYLGTLTNDSQRTAGSQLVDFRYDAWNIFRNVDDGPYYVFVNLVAYVDGVSYAMDSSWFTSPAYLRSQFEAPPAMFQPPHSDHANDTDGDTYYDFLAVDAHVNITVAGEYTVSGNLLDWLGATIESDANTTYLSVGVHTVELIFPGWPIRYDGDSGPWDVDLTLTDSSSLVLDSTTYTTGFYSYTSFRGTPAVFSAPYSDQGLDLNGDSLYDYLVVDANVTVSVAGTYTVHGDLNDNWYSYIVDASNTTFLTVGTHTVELRYPGWLIRNHGVTGVFYVYLYLYDDGGRTCDSHTYTTSSYTSTSFQTPPAQFGILQSSYALDDDADGLYDWIVVNATVDVAMAGAFEITASCTDSLGWWVANAANRTTLASGTQVMQIKIPAWMIYANARNGTYSASMILRDPTGNQLDSFWYTTASYQYTSFDPIPPMISSPYTSSAPVINGLFGGNEWTWATEIDLGADPLNQVPARMLVMNNATMLFVAYDVYGDTTQSSNDYASIGFDTSNDNQTTNGKEDEFAIYASGTVHYTYNSGSFNWQWHCSPFNDALPNHAGMSGAIGFGPSVGHPTNHRIYEFAIPLALLGASPGDVLGFIGRDYWNYGIFDAYAGTHSEWPATFVGSPPLDKYGELTLATPSILPPPVTTAALSGTVGTGGWYITAVGVTLTAVGGDGGIRYTQYRIDGGAWQTYAAPFSVSTSGSRTVEYRSVDHANQAESIKSISFMVDATPPTTTATRSGPVGPGGWYRGTVTVSLTAHDDVGGTGLKATWYTLDGGAWTLYSVPLTVSAAGSHTVQFRSTDNASGNETIKSVSANIDLVAPATTAESSGATIWLNATDADSSVSSTMYRIDGGVWKAYSGQFVVTGNGSHTVEYYSVDAAGNQEATGSINVNVVERTSGLSGLLPYMLIVVVAAIAAALLLMFLLVRKRRQQETVTGAPYPVMSPVPPQQQMPPQAPPQAPPQTPPQMPPQQ